ncbi:MAG: hypothetical protein AVDCRST_MAG49-1001, partial [uncultured Thermomicrobiales bacterium]
WRRHQSTRPDGIGSRRLLDPSAIGGVTYPPTRSNSIRTMTSKRCRPND